MAHGHDDHGHGGHGSESHGQEHGHDAHSHGAHGHDSHAQTHGTHAPSAHTHAPPTATPDVNTSGTGPIGDEIHSAGETAADRIIRGEIHTQRLKTEAEGLKLQIKNILEDNVETEEERLPKIAAHPQLFFAAVALFAFLMLTAVITSIIFIASGKHLLLAGIPLRFIGGGLLVLAAVYFYKSWGSVRQDELGGVTFYHRPVTRYEHPGPVFQPPGLLKLVTDSRNDHQFVYPGDVNKIVRHHTADGQPAGPEKYAEGEVRGMYATTGSPMAKELEAIKELRRKGLPEAAEILFHPITVDVRCFVRVRVRDVFLYERVITGNSPDERRAELETRFREIVESELKEIIATLTPATVIQCWEWIGVVLTLRLRKQALYWGVWVEKFGITEQNLSHGTNLAQAKANRAAYDKVTTMRAAEAKSYEFAEHGRGQGIAKTAVGEGEANAIQARMQAEAMGFEALALKLGIKDKREILFYVENMTKLINGANYSMWGASGPQDLMAAVSAMKGLPAAGSPPPQQSNKKSA